MKHLGDITLIKGNEVPIVDCIIGGSPCQDLSLAGKRAGLAGAKSGLYMEQIRLIEEMRENDRTNGRTGVDVRPRYIVWENVPGAFSTNQGQDFAAVLEEAIRVAEPEAPNVSVPEKGWPTAGCIMGDNWSVAWRVLDAQFWGVPQRRRRIALVADFGGHSAPEILFVRESVSGDIEPGKPKGKEAPRDAGNSAGGAIGCDIYNLAISGDKAVSLTTASNATGTGPTVAQPVAYNGSNITSPINQTNPQPGDPCHTLTDDNRNYLVQPVIAVDQGGGKSGANHYEEMSPTLTCTHGGEPAVVYGISPYHSNCMKSDNPHSGYYEADTARTLDALQCGYPGCNQGGMAVVQPMAYSIENHPADSRVDICDSGKVQTLTSRIGTGGGNVPMVMETYQRVTGPLMANSHPGSYTGQDAYSDMLVTGSKHIVRRLTPLECERLQGFPDGWTDIGEWVDSKGKKHKEADSPRYKALGNSIAIPPWKWVLKRLCACYERDATMASLFDGIGGFPYIWEQLNGNGSCLWASEIEEFPMAVTKIRFGG